MFFKQAWHPDAALSYAEPVHHRFAGEGVKDRTQLLVHMALMVSYVYRYPDVAERVRWHCRLTGMTQGAYAASIGASRSRFNNCENGAKRPAVDFAVRLRNRYGLTLAFIYVGDDRDLPRELPEAWRSRSI